MFAYKNKKEKLTLPKIESLQTLCAKFISKFF